MPVWSTVNLIPQPFSPLGSQVLMFHLVIQGVECYCGQSLPSSGLVADTECSMACAGDSSSKCGSSYRVSIYQISGSSNPTTGTSWTQLGCYSDDSSTRTLSYQITTLAANTVTPTTCNAACLAKGYVFAGVEYGSECYCGSTMVTSTSPSSGQVATTGDCSKPCSGDSSIMCGGSYRIGIWSYGGVPPTTPTPSAWKRLGCFTDNTSSRTLPDYSTSFSSTN